MPEQDAIHNLPEIQVVVTGIGCVCPTLSDEHRESLLPGVDSGWIEPTELFPENKSLRLLSRDGLLAVIAARRAMLDAGLRLYDPDDDSQPDPARVGLFGATGMMPLPEKDLARLTSYSTDSEGRFDARRMGSEALRRTRPILSFKILGNMPICFVSIFENIQGSNNVYAPTEAQGKRAIEAGFQAIQRGEVDITLVGATDSKTSRLDRASMIQLGLATSEPGLIDEAAAFLVLERKEHAEARAAKIRAEVSPSTLSQLTLAPSPATGSTALPVAGNRADGRANGPFAATAPLQAVMALSKNSKESRQVAYTAATTRSKKRVVVTGLGIVTPLGATVDSFWKSLLAGNSALKPIRHFDATTFQTTIAAEITDDTTDWNKTRLQNAWPEVDLAKIRDRKVLFALDAALQAISQSGIDPAQLADAVLCLGVGLESVRMQDLIDMIAAKENASCPDSSFPVREPVDLAARLLGERFGLRAGRHTNVSACAAGAMAIGEAYHLIASGEVSVALCGGSDSMINPLGLGGFGLLGVLSAGEDGRLPACLPFHSKRDGTLIGEGAGILVLESEESAQRRGATILCEVAGFASTLDARSVTDPALDGQGITRCMQNAVANAGILPESIDTINAHATGTVTGDQVEADAIRKLFGDRRPLPVSAIKSQLGHTIGASGAIEAIASVLTLRDQIIPQTVGLDEPDARCSLDHVIGSPHRMEVRTVLSNSFGLGGQNASIVFQK